MQFHGMSVCVVDFPEIETFHAACFGTLLGREETGRVAVKVA